MSPGYVFCAALCAFGCGDGALTLELHMPEREALSPASGDRVAEVTLITWGPDAPRQSETRAVTERGVSLDMGALDTDAELTLAVELRSQTQRLVGYGRTAGPLLVRDGAGRVVPLEVRRPFAYVPGGGAVDLGGAPRPLSPTLSTFDASVDPRASLSGKTDYRGAVAIDFEPRAAVTTPDGRDLVVVGAAGAGGVLSLVSTRTHELTPGAEIALADVPVDVAVAPDGRFAIVGHGGQEGAVSIVDLDQVRGGGGAAPELIRLGEPVGTVVVASDRDGRGSGFALVLLNRARSLDCAGASASSVVKLSLTGETETPLTIDYGAPIHDIAVSADGSTILAADGCRDGVYEIPVDGGTVSRLLDLQDASAIAVLDGRMWAAGALSSSAEEARRPTLVSLDLTGGSETRFDLPQELALAIIDHPDFSGTVQQKLPAEALRVIDVAVAPGGSQVALLAEARFHADELIVEDFVPAFPPFDMLTYEYFLVDASSGGITQRVRTLCELQEVNPQSYFYSGWKCDVASDQDALPAAEEYVPHSLAVLYGAR